MIRRLHARRALLLALVLGTSVVPAHSQSNLSTPSGWTKTFSSGKTVFSQPESGSRFTIQKLMPLNGSLRGWFETQLERDSRTRGKLRSPGTIQWKNGNYLVGRLFQNSSGNLSVIYLGYASGTQGRFLTYASTTPQALKEDLPAFLTASKQLLAIDTAARKQIAKNSIGSGKSSASAGAQGSVSIASVPPIRGKVGQFWGVFLNESYISGVGGMPLLTYEPVLLLRDGTARRNAELPPGDVLTARDRAAHPRDWGRWTRNGDKIKLRWGDGDTDEIKASFISRPARSGERLSGSYTSLSGGGNTALGGNIMTFSSNSYTFSRDGRFTTERSGGGSSPSITASSSSKNAGRYQLDGHTITFKFNDGRQIRRLFFFYPGKNEGNVLGIGDSPFVGDD